MLGNAKHLRQYSLLPIINLRIVSKRLILILILLPNALFTSAAATPARNIVEIETKQTQLLPYRLRLIEPAIAPEEVRSMTRKLQGLIGRFEATLLSAEAYNSSVDLSTSKVVQQILEQNITSKQISKRLRKFNYRNSHYALQLAHQKFQRFHDLIDRQQYNQAQAEWSAAKKILWDNYPREKPVGQSEVRGMWLDRGTIVKAKSEADLVKVFDRMAVAGINTVFFETLNSSYTIYPSRVAPQQNPLVKNWDPLKAAVKLAHERGMELHAWVWTFAAVNQRHNVILDLPRNHLGPVISRHPDWAITDQKGSRFHYSSRKIFLDPANPEVRDYLSSLLTEIATEYEVDGIHLDYIRYPFQSPTGKMTYGYGLAAREQFKAQTGFDPLELNPYHFMWSRWIEFRIGQVDSFVAEVSQNLKQLRPELTLSTAVFPMNRQERLFKIQQHWEKWVQQEWIDILIPMTYAKNADRLYTLTNPLLEEFERGKVLLMPGIRLLNISDVTALDQMQLLRGMSTEGYVLFAAENLNSEMMNIFNRTQGSISVESKQLLPHRKPFEVTLSRYQSLQKEWNFFLANNTLETEDAVLQKWGIQADILALRLQKLVEEPSNKNFLATELALFTLRRQFPQWMKATKGIDVYQAKTWQNRLDTLTRLLDYGQRKNLSSDRQEDVISN